MPIDPRLLEAMRINEDLARILNIGLEGNEDEGLAKSQRFFELLEHLAADDSADADDRALAQSILASSREHFRHEVPHALSVLAEIAGDEATPAEDRAKAAATLSSAAKHLAAEGVDIANMLIGPDRAQ